MASSSRAKEQIAQNRAEAFRHRLRGRILRLLVEGPSSPSKMAKVLEAKPGDVNYHTKRLVELGFAELADLKPANGSVEHIYRATDRYLVETKEWEDLPDEVKDHASAEFAQAHIDDMVLGFRARTLGTHEHFHLTQTRILVDERGRDEGMQITERARQELADVESRSAKRRLKSKETGTHMSSLLAWFEVPPDKETSPENA